MTSSRDERADEPLAPYKEDQGEGKVKEKTGLSLYLAAFSACLLIVGGGNIVVWTSPVISRLLSNDTDVNPLGRPVTTLEISQLGGLPALGGIISPILFTRFCDIIGRKKVMMIISSALLVLTVVLGFAQTISLYLLTRFLQGLGFGAAISCCSIFLSEISEDHNRGSIGVILGLALPIGNLYVYVLGPLFSIKVFTLLCAVPYVLNLLAFVFYIPESPVYLASKGRKEEAVRALERLRSKTPGEVEKEYEKILHILSDSKGRKEGVFKTMLNIFRTKSYRRGMVIALGINFVQHFSGVAAILAFAGPLFDEAKAGISGNVTGILIGIIKVSSMVMATVIIEKAGRRPLLIFSALCSSVCLFTVGTFFFLQSIHSPILPQILWLPIVATLLYFVSYSVGIGGIPMAMMSELFPSKVKSAAVSIVTLFIGMCVALVTTLFPIMKELVGATWCFWSFGFMTVLGTVFIYFAVPEIKGMNVLQIQELLSK